MTPEHIQAVVDYLERTWRSRTPSTRVDEVNASYRVGRGEMRLWCRQNNIQLDEMDEDFQVASTRMYFRLYREFPHERWDYPVTAATQYLCKTYKITIPNLPRIRKQHPLPTINPLD